MAILSKNGWIIMDNFNFHESLRSIGKILNVSYMTIRARLEELNVLTIEDNLHKDAVIRKNKKRKNKEIK